MLAAADSITTIYQMRLQLYPVHAVAICLPTKLTGFGSFVASNLLHNVSPWCGFFVFFPLKLCWWWSDLLSGRCDAPSKPVFSKTSRIEHDSEWKQQTSGSTHVFLDGGMKTFQQLHHSFCTENPLMFLRMSYGDLKFQGLRVQGEAWLSYFLHKNPLFHTSAVTNCYRVWECNAYYDDGQCAAAGGWDNGASYRPLVGIAFGVLKDPKWRFTLMFSIIWST